MLESLTELVTGSPWTYLLVLAVAALDALVPLVPSETTAIAAGVLAGAGDLNIAFVLAAAAAGAFAGDATSYGLGRRFGDSAGSLVFRGKGGPRRRSWAERALKTRGATIVVGARFVPGGRTAATLTAGILKMPVRRYARLAALAAVLWASYASLVGYLGGRAFEDSAWKGLVLALGLAFAIAAVVELSRRALRRRPALARC
jgi:membrane protein DedA with SNARE-associated domain